MMPHDVLELFSKIVMVVISVIGGALTQSKEQRVADRHGVGAERLRLNCCLSVSLFMHDIGKPANLANR